MDAPFNASMAFWASSGVAMVTKRKPARATAHAVHHQVGLDDRAVRGKGVLQVIFSGVEGKISNKQFRTHVMFYCPLD